MNNGDYKKVFHGKARGSGLCGQYARAGTRFRHFRCRETPQRAAICCCPRGRALRPWDFTCVPRTLPRRCGRRVRGCIPSKKVPAIISDPSSLSADTSHAGWTLAAVYEDVSAPLRSLTLWCGSTAVSLAAGSTDVSVSGFLTPDALPVSGKIFVSAQEGDAVIGDFLRRFRLFGVTRWVYRAAPYSQHRYGRECRSARSVHRLSKSGR